MSALLDMSDVSAGYGPAQALWDIDLAVAEGGATALIGRNGVGKSTLLSAIVGTRPIMAGTIRFAGEDVSAFPPHLRARRGIAHVPQGRHIFPHLTVQENLETGLSALGGRSQGRPAVPEHVFELFPKLRDIRQRKGGLLSGGEQQQLAIGRALAGNPRLLLLDEPTEGIQPNVVQQIEDALRRIRTEFGVTILIVEQYLDFAWAFADDYCAMQEGRIIRRGTTASDSAADVAHLIQI